MTVIDSIILLFITCSILVLIPFLQKCRHLTTAERKLIDLPLSFLEDLGHGGRLILDFQVELALLREDEELLHHLVKHLHLLYVGEGV